MTRPAESPGRPLEARGNARPREMAVPRSARTEPGVSAGPFAFFPLTWERGPQRPHVDTSRTQEDQRDRVAGFDGLAPSTLSTASRVRSSASCHRCEYVSSVCGPGLGEADQHCRHGHRPEGARSVDGRDRLQGCLVGVPRGRPGPSHTRVPVRRDHSAGGRQQGRAGDDCGVRARGVARGLGRRGASGEGEGDDRGERGGRDLCCAVRHATNVGIGGLRKPASERTTLLRLAEQAEEQDVAFGRDRGRARKRGDPSRVGRACAPDSRESGADSQLCIAAPGERVSSRR